MRLCLTSGSIVIVDAVAIGSIMSRKTFRLGGGGERECGVKCVGKPAGINSKIIGYYYYFGFQSNFAPPLSSLFSILIRFSLNFTTKRGGDCMKSTSILWFTNLAKSLITTPSSRPSCVHPNRSLQTSVFQPFESTRFVAKKSSRMPPKKKVEEAKIILGRPGNNLKVSRGC